MRRSSKQIGFVKHYVEFTNCAVQATKLEWKSQSTSEIFANSISQIPRALATAHQRLRFLRRQLTKKRPGTVVCGYRKVPATDRLTGFATAAPRTPERTRAPVAQGSCLSTVRRGHRRTVWRPTVMTPTGCEASPQFTLIDTGRGWVSLLRCAWYEHSGEAVDYTCSTKSQSPMQHAIWHIGN